MNKMKTKVLALMLIVIMALTGCATEEANVKINSDGSGIYHVNVTIDEEAYIDTTLKIYKAAGMTNEEIKATEKLLRTEAASSFKEMGAKEVTIDGRKCYQITETANVKPGQMTKTCIGEEQGYITPDTFYYRANVAKMVGEAFGESMGTGADASEMEAMFSAAGVDMGDLMKVTISIEFPKPVISTVNGVVDASNKNKVSFKLNLKDSKTLFATTNSQVTLAGAAAKYKADNTIKKPSIKALRANKVSKRAKKATALLKIRKVTGAKKYEVQYSRKASFKGAKKKTIKKTTYKLTKLRKGSKYYVRVRAVKYNMGGKVITSKWAKKSVKTKK